MNNVLHRFDNYTYWLTPSGALTCQLPPSIHLAAARGNESARRGVTCIDECTNRLTHAKRVRSNSSVRTAADCVICSREQWHTTVRFVFIVCASTGMK
jgi:hypothetical protein